MTDTQHTDEALSVEFDLDLNDVVAFNEYHAAHSPLLRRGLMMYRLVPAAIGFVAGAIMALSDWSEGIKTAVLSVVVPGLWIAVAPWVYRRRIRQNVKKLYREGRNAAVFGRQTLAISASGFTRTASGAHSEARWDAVERVASTPGYLFIYTSAVTAHIVPRRAFPDDRSFDAFTAAARRWAEGGAVG